MKSKQEIIKKLEEFNHKSISERAILGHHKVNKRTACAVFKWILGDVV